MIDPPAIAAIRREAPTTDGLSRALDKLVLCLFVVVALAGCTRSDPKGGKALPPSAVRALSNLEHAELVSLEPLAAHDAPGPRLEGRLVLGSTKLTDKAARNAASAIRSAAANWNGDLAACFDPRHALRTRSRGHSYDVLICYACQSLEVFEDGKSVGGAGVTGSPDALNRILLAANVPISHSGEELEARPAEDARRWEDASPASVRGLIKANSGLEVNLQPFQDALAAEFPERKARIRALLRWYGSGAGPWSGYPSYEDVAAELLFGYPTREIVSAIQTNDLSAVQLEGAARLFGGWSFRVQRPSDGALLPRTLRKRLLAHSLNTGDKDKIVRARQAFGPE